ncbi:ankyrin [Aspergillus vadensis CBS 113365]|uniref:Ankyrin n=1 Tax=Aspergillus vadensis (strain CBS 113365 / IMI 142717 / IBT 24658) TaxID=1448311 RepID=A0A319BIW2_ASPVC|nr:ankyrin [Aspergillus vadensis CBS 113365]PYH71859.1 ankyrin [Aspergillus vadensis CBS 113365]
MEHQQPHLLQNPPKRRKLDLGESPRRLSHDDYTIGWVCALAIEAAAAMAMLDQIHPALPIHARDSNSYTLGSIGRHNIVIACLPAGVYGTTSAATVASNMFISFGSIHHLVMVGIGGGVPSASVDIRLGDVVVSIPTPCCEGVVQYDYGKTIRQGHFERTGTLNKPSTALLTAVSNLRAADLRNGSQIPVLISEMLARNPQMVQTSTSPGSQRDLLFASDYEHDPAEPTCESCDREKLLVRSTRSSDRPVVHYGLIASGNQVIKHAQTRDLLAAELNGILCFEMEAAGLMDNFPCIVIRGVSDYSDSHKNKDWQGYAAATAAAYAKQLLATIGVCGLGPISDPAVPGAITAAQHRASMMDALRPDQHESRQATIKPAHAKTCRWLLEKQEYVNWMDSNRFPEHRGFLWIKGKAGSGKSTMMKFAFLQADATVDADTKVISFFFNARGEDVEKSTLGMYRSLLAQILEKVPELQVLLDELDFERWDEEYPWCHEILQCTLRRSISQLGGRRVICFVDALDECEEEQVRAMVEFIQSLGEHAISSNVHLHVCFSSRHYPHIAIEEGLELILEDQEGHANDITRYLQSELKIGRSKQAEDIRREIQAKASGIFLWMVLVVRILNREFQRGRLHALRKRLRETPAKLSDLFIDILTRDTANMEDLLLSIQWILFARRPLKREELYFAILSADPDNLTEAWDPEDVTEQDIDRFILSASKGLAETTRSKAKTVQFIHESVRDFLLKENGLRELWPEHQGNFEASSHDRLKQCCNNTLLSETSNRIADEQFIASASRDELKALRGSVCRKVPFLQYAVHNVLQHSEAAEKGGIRQGCFLGNFNFSRWKRCSNILERYKARRHTESACLPYILAKYDLSNLILAIYKDKPCGSIPSRRDLDFLVSYAVRNDHRDFLDSIIRSQLQDASASSTACIEMALRYTIQYDREAMFANLITHIHVNLNQPDKDGKQYLHYVIQYGRDSMFDRMLAMREVDLNAPDVHGDTPLHYAIRFEQQYIFTKLIRMDRINLSAQNMANQTLLHCAMQYGREKMFDLLLMRDNADITAHLCSAIERNDELVFNRLLATQPVNVNTTNENGKKPMLLAIERSNPAMIKSLLEMSCTEVPLSEQGWNRMLQSAALNRWGEIVELLVTMEDLFSHLNSPCAEAVLLYAAWSGNKALVDRILATGKSDPNAKALDGKTALAYAAYGGYTDIAMQLLSTENIEPDVKDWYGMTPLAYAASRGYENIVIQLLSTEGINPDFKDMFGFTPLSEAAVNGHEDVVRRLLANRRPDVLPDDVGGRKALLAAKAYQHDRIVKILEDWLTLSPHFEPRSTA